MDEDKFFNEFKAVPTKFVWFTIHHKLEKTMVGVKVATIPSPITSTNTSCSICGLTCSKLNDLDLVEKFAAELPDDMFKHGM